MTETKTIKPIETVYDGYRFRSRLEARWAVFLRTMEWSFEYEPEGYELPDGTLYLPDFLLHGVYLWDGFYRAEKRYLGDVFLEIKGKWTEEDCHKVVDFAMAGNNVLTLGNVLDPGPGSREDYLLNYLSRSMKEVVDSGKWYESHMHYRLLTTKKCDSCSLECGHIGPRIGVDLDDGYCHEDRADMALYAGKRRQPVIGAFHTNGHYARVGDGLTFACDLCDEDLTRAAYTAARQARFEHGETPRATSVAL